MWLHPFLPQQALFKAYDIRGDITLFSDDFLWALGQGFARLFAQHGGGRVAIGYDVRKFSPRIAAFIAYHCHVQGLSIDWLGQVTTPMMAHAASCQDGHGVMVTASHSPRHVHGVKWLCAHHSPSAEAIGALFDTLADVPAYVPTAADLAAVQAFASQLGQADATVFNAYQASMTQAFARIQHACYCACTPRHAPLRLVIDCMNGATSRFAERLFSGFGYDCQMLNAMPDGSFPKGNPDPAEPARLAELSHAVVASGADMGLAFDGDGDRVMVIDGHGRMIAPDNLLYLLAQIALAERPTLAGVESTAEVMFDVKCSHHVPTLLAAHGALPVMQKTGSSLMRQALQRRHRASVFAGELSGHFLFNDGYFVLYDDAMYAALRLLNWLRYQPVTFAELLASLPVSVSTADMYLPIASAEYGQRLLNQLLAAAQKPFSRLRRAFAVREVSTVDGLRLDFAHGVGILRRSNTGNYLTVRFCGDTLADLQHAQRVFSRLCASVDDDLAAQVAQIQPV